MKMKLTIFTPTHNRADKLNRVYKSLRGQYSFDFEWLIIDDGSTDDTETLVQSFLSEKYFFVRYYRQENGGKHRAYNRALKMAQGDWFFCLDSDDWLAKDAIEQIMTYINKEDKRRFIVAYKMDEKGMQLSDNFPCIHSCKLKELDQKYHCNGEYSMIFPIELARKFPFPLFEGERFVTESVVYDRLGAASDVTLLPRVLTVCEYQEDGLSNNLNQIMKNNPAGYCLYFMQRIDYYETFLQRFITAGKYQCFCRFAGKQKSKYIGKHPVMVTLAKPLGLLFLLYYKILRGF